MNNIIRVKVLEMAARFSRTGNRFMRRLDQGHSGQIAIRWLRRGDHLMREFANTPGWTLLSGTVTFYCTGDTLCRWVMGDPLLKQLAGLGDQLNGVEKKVEVLEKENDCFKKDVEALKEDLDALKREQHKLTQEAIDKAINQYKKDQETGSDDTDFDKDNDENTYHEKCRGDSKGFNLAPTLGRALDYLKGKPDSEIRRRPDPTSMDEDVENLSRDLPTAPTTSPRQSPRRSYSSPAAGASPQRSVPRGE